jgi:hypothetical protein
VIDGLAEKMMTSVWAHGLAIEQFLLLIVGGAFGGIVYAVSNLLEQGATTEQTKASKGVLAVSSTETALSAPQKSLANSIENAGISAGEPSHRAWAATRGCGVSYYLLGQALIGTGGAFATVFAVLTLGHTVSAKTDFPPGSAVYIFSLCVVGGFVANRLLKEVGENLANRLTKTEKKAETALSAAKEADNKAVIAKEAADKAGEMSEMLSQATIARSFAERLELLNQQRETAETGMPVGSHTPSQQELTLRAEGEGALVKLAGFESLFPTERMLFIVSANLMFELGHAKDAFGQLRKFLQNRREAGLKEDDPDAAAWLNIACYYAVLSKSKVTFRDYTAPLDKLQSDALDALANSLEIAKKCGPSALQQRLDRLTGDRDIRLLEELDGFKALMSRFTRKTAQ